MESKRKTEKFEDDRKKWEILFDLVPEAPMYEKVIDIRFRLNKEGVHSLREQDLTNLKQDLKDLGKFRIIKQGRFFLKNEN